MKYNIIFIFLVFGMSGCFKPSEKEVSIANINNPAFKRVLDLYIRNIDRNKNDNITVSIERKEDTTLVSLINSLPDTTQAKLNGFLKFNACNIYFIGEYPTVDIYTLEKKSVIFIEKAKSKDLSKLRHVEPLFWELYFIGNKLVKSHPEFRLE